MNLKDLQENSYPAYYQTYLDHLPNDNFLRLLRIQKEEMLIQLKSLKEKDLLTTYAVDKWTVAEVLQHIIDTERIFQYRALAIARGDKTSLPGYDHNAYVPNSKANERNLNGFIEEYLSVRDAGLTLFKSFSIEMLETRGISNGHELSAGAAGFIIAGHEKHHIKLFRSNYKL